MSTATRSRATPAEAEPGGPVVAVLPSGDRAMSVGTMLLVAADFVVLGAILAAYFSVKGSSQAWPPEGVEVGTYIPTVVTITAVLGSFAAQWALYAARRNDQRNVAIGFSLAAFFGLAVANAEWSALTEAGFGVASHPYGTFYFLLFGYHLVHVLAIVPLMGLVAGRAVAGHFPASRVGGVRATAIAWHASTGLWYLIVTALFLLSRHA